VIPKIGDYAVIGDCHGAALVALDGSIDWCAIGRFDADPIFCRILDEHRGGCLTTQPDSSFKTSRQYAGPTNVLQTTFTTPTGSVQLTDAMPVGRESGSGVHDYVHLLAGHALIRMIEGIDGHVDLDLTFRPVVDFARSAARLELHDDGVHTNAGADLRSTIAFTLDGDRARAHVTVRKGERHVIVVGRYAGKAFDRVDELLRVTRAFWSEWSDYCRYDGPYRDRVLRSALTLKLLTYAPTGAIAAAATTSLPEEIGGVRNWDYRYCWLRDASFTLYALAALGYSGEARRFMDYTQLACRASYPRIQIMYGVGAEARLDERELDHLAGYRGSRPVRVGNAAFEQDQLDVYGEVVDWAYLQMSLGQRFSRSSREFFRYLAEQVASNWEKPDQGIWEMRTPGRNHVFGKIVAWAALDRATKMFGRRFRKERDEIHDAILRRGVDRQSGALKDCFETEGADAAVLLAPMLGFPLDDREDGLPGKDGAFLACSFWLADALLVLDRGDEAREVFEATLRCANDVGLFSEQTTLDAAELLGNFPQALTHLSLINSAVNLELYATRGANALRGSHAERARYTVEATAGLRAWWAAFRKSHRVGRLRSSRESVLQ
jgi:GH15 family glucan-1,4-alpha-glucosidase